MCAGAKGNFSKVQDAEADLVDVIPLARVAKRSP